MRLTGANTITKGTALPSMFPFEFGAYRVLSLLGRGGMGAVYEAEQRDTGRRVALKVLGQELDSPEMRKRFLREGRLAAAVSHPNSIYIFGTEEIEGAPVIVMEVAGGGTLKDELKKRGPLPVKAAVDAMLQIIAGLEAAHAGGVLHRDVKPANCFLAPDGTAKVGDFGLSVSTMARQDSQLTASGVMLGTPSFAPPEQLRGEELDVRADIYSTGATLYSLLTGKPPFDGENVVNVVTNVLDKAPRPITEFRKDVPAGLAQIIARCLAKKREERFASYSELRDALLPFSSTMPTPAPLGLRFLAGLADDFFASVPEIVLGTLLSVEFADRYLSERSSATLLPWLGIWVCYIAYFAIAEGVWGAGLGKALCGLRVVGPGGNAPGIGRALVRMLVYDLMAMSTLLPLLFTSGAEYAGLIESGDYLGRWWFYVPIIAFIGLFVTMRRSNGFAAVQDYVSGTRVVLRIKTTARPKLEAPALPLPPETGARIGPYRVGEAVGSGFIAGYDEVLRRAVWIRQYEADAAPVSDARRAAARATRLRWIGGVRSEAANWDAFEALQGQPLAALVPQSQPWSAVRHWLQDLTTELDVAAKDVTLPATVTLAQVWLTTDGRAVLLDEAVAADPPHETFDAAQPEHAQKFLHAVVAHALDLKTLPLHARDLLHKLAAGSFDRLSFVAGNVQSLIVKPAAITVRRRAASLLLIPCFLLLGYALVMTAGHFQQQHNDSQWRELHPELLPLSQVLRLRAATDPNGGLLFAWRKDFNVFNATGIYIAAHYLDKLGASVIKKPSADPGVPLDEDERQEVIAIFSKHASAEFVPLLPPERRLSDGPAFPKSVSPPLTAAQIASADATLQTELPKFLVEDHHRVLVSGKGALLKLLMLTGIMQFVSLLIFGVTVGQKLFGFAVLNQRGEQAGRLRMLGRWCLAWLPIIFLSVKLETSAVTHAFSTADIVKCSAYALMWLLGLIVAIANPPQGVHDEQTGTWLVPR